MDGSERKQGRIGGRANYTGFIPDHDQAILQVFTMLMGEFDFTANFVTSEDSSPVAKVGRKMNAFRSEEQTQ